MTTPTIEAALARVKDWIARCGESNYSIATAAGVDEKTVRQAHRDGWNPTAEIVGRLETVIPEDWRAGDPIPDNRSAA
ncbi:hypothetical protein [Reyranella sp.]|uniref:hypothetical protein n=1 Tax=Reyranella sp. TaxID=1929291 RepID=UPI003D0B8D3F